MSKQLIAFGLAWALVLPGLREVRGANTLQEKATPEEIKKLVEQLGAASKDDRTRAEKRLVKIGPAALAALRETIFHTKDKALAQAARGVVERIGAGVHKELEGLLARRKAKGYTLARIKEEAVARTFPAHLAFVVRFRQYPAAVRPPAPLKVQNLFMVGKDGEPEQVTDFKSLHTFFRENLGKVLEEDEARHAARAWLRLVQEFYQDGYFKFSIPADGLKAGPAKTGVQAGGRAVVKPERGNKGAIRVTLRFGLTGELEAVDQEQDVLKGQRPR
jgi:hypothetical protein